MNVDQETAVGNDIILATAADHIRAASQTASLEQRGRPDINVRDHGAAINARIGLNTWAAFAGTDADAMVAGDIAMLEPEVTPVLEALRGNGLDVVAIHHHMTDIQPVVVFLHYYGTGQAAILAQGVRSTVDLLGKTPAMPH